MLIAKIIVAGIIGTAAFAALQAMVESTAADSIAEQTGEHFEVSSMGIVVAGQVEP
jgi:hypothetical protein